MNFLSNVRQTRSQTRAQQVNANLNISDNGMAPSKSSEESMSGRDGDGELRECAGCDRPNNAERYMVQCRNCNHWYHFTCANVNTATVRSSSYLCVLCIPGEVCGVPEPTPSQFSGISSSSSTRKAKIDRELQRLEEEQKLLEELNRERIEKERELNERELLERLERGKQFIARKHELLSQHDEEEGRSVHSMRSSRHSEKRTEDWVRQTRTTEISGEVIGRETPAPASASTNHAVGDALLTELQRGHPSSTPIKTVVSAVTPFVDDRAETGSEVKSVPQTLGSITIGEDSVDSLEDAADAGKQERENHPVNLPYVDLQPYADLLKVEEAAPSSGSVLNAGAVPKINRFSAQCYKRWSVETGELRKQELHLQRQVETEQVILDVMTKQQSDIDARRKREMVLVSRIKYLQLQHATELKTVRESEVRLRAQLQQRDRDRIELEGQVEALGKILREDREQMRTMEVELRGQLQERDRESESLQRQLAELRSEVKILRSREQHLQSQNEAAQQREHNAIRLRNEAEKQYWDLHEEIEQIISRNDDRSTDGDCFSSLPPPPASWIGVTGSSDTGIHPPLVTVDDGGFLNRQQEFLAQCEVAHTPNTSSSMQGNHLHLPAQVIGDASGYFGPSPQQLAARQVVIKELPIFSGDPVDWPLFISSYQHSTEACGYTDSENLLRLQRCLRGNAKDSVSSFLLHPSTVPQVLSTLKLLYGRPEQIVNNMIAKVRATPAPKADRLDTLVSFGLVVQNLCGHLKAVGLQRYLTNPILLQELVEKLPTTVKFNWALYQEQVPIVDLNVFSDYMAKISSAASGITQLANMPQNCFKEERNRPKERSFVNMHGSSEQLGTSNREDVEKSIVDERVQKGRDHQSKCSICNEGSHQIGSCTAFNALDLDGRWEAVKMHKLCARCLTSHARWPCKGQVCGIDGCPKRHHRMLHYTPAATADYQSDSYSSS